jgi:hypothetical protein
MQECTYTTQVRKNGMILKKLTSMWRFLLHTSTYEPSINILNYTKAECGGKEDGCSLDGSAGYISAPQLRPYDPICVVEWVYRPASTYEYMRHCLHNTSICKSIPI